MTFEDELIKVIKNLPEKRDERYSKFVQAFFIDNKFTLLHYLEGTLRELACYSEDKYKICILENYKMICFNKDVNDIPVPTGLWMDWWEEDFQKYFGVTRKSYSKMSLKDRAFLECKLEIKKGWPQQEYFYLYAEFYNSKEYDKWWWEDPMPISEKQDKKEEYWRGKYFEEIKNSAEMNTMSDLTTGIEYLVTRLMEHPSDVETMILHNDGIHGFKMISPSREMFFVPLSDVFAVIGKFFRENKADLDRMEQMLDELVK